MCANSTKIQVLQYETKQPVQYANVCWQVVGSFEKQGNTITNADGEANISSEAGSAIILSVTCVGFKPVLDTIQIQQSMRIYMEEDVLNLEQVTVTGTRTPHVLKKAPVLTQLISEDEIRSVDSETLPDILNVEIPGMEMANHGGIPVMNVMGLEAEYTLVLIDGERMAKTLHRTVDYSRINSANIERIEIVRGASSALYGSNAMGSVINIITKKPKKKWDISANARYQQRNEKNHTQLDLDNSDDDYMIDYFKNMDRQNLNGNLSVGYSNKGFYSNTFVNYKTHDGFVLKSTKPIEFYLEEQDLVLTDDELFSAGVSGFKDYTVEQKIGFNKGKWDFGLTGSIYNHDEYDFSPDALHDLYKSYRAGANAKYKLDGKSNIKFSHNADIYQRFDYSEKHESKSKEHQNAYHTSKLTYNTNLGKHTILAELENLYEYLWTDDRFGGLPGSKTTNHTVLVLQDQFQWVNSLTFVAGIRTGYHTTFDFHASPSLTAKYSFNSFNFRLSYARGFRSPDLKELYTNWSHLGMFQIIGNEDLKPETNNYYSFSIDYVNEQQDLNATFIASYNDFKNKIDGLWTNNDQEYRYVNFSEAQVLSIEALLKWKFHKDFKLKAGYIFLDSKKSVDASDLSIMAPMAITTQLEYRFVKDNYQLVANLSGKITGEKEVPGTVDIVDSAYDGYPSVVKYPGFSLWNINVNQYFGKHIKVGLGFRNLFDYVSPFATFNTSRSPGRKYFVSIGYRL